MAKVDPVLGAQVKEHLTNLGLETTVQRINLNKGLEALETGVGQFLSGMGLDVNDPSLQDTPKRVAEMYTYELCAGLNYDNFPKCTTTPNGIATPIVAPATQSKIGGEPQMDYIGAVDEMVITRRINTVSLCEHHFQTIHGYTYIAYLPKTKLLGLSKFARVTNFFARRPQVQERMTEQIYAALSFIMDTPDIAVYQCCVHNCMRARGAMDPHSDTITSKMGGRFRDAAVRQEFLNAIPRT